MTLVVLNAFARDIQRRVRGRIIRTTRKQENCAATRIQAWYQGWRVRSRDGYGAVLSKMRTHRLERARRMQVRIIVMRLPILRLRCVILCCAALPRQACSIRSIYVY